MIAATATRVNARDAARYAGRCLGGQNRCCCPVAVLARQFSPSPKAYEAAKKDDYSVVHNLFSLFENPYDEQPDMEAKYYKRAPDSALLTAGTAFMS